MNLIFKEQHNKLTTYSCNSPCHFVVPGEAVVRPQDVCGWQVALSVCYDLRFPGLFQALRRPHTAAQSTAASGSDGAGACGDSGADALSDGGVTVPIGAAAPSQRGAEILLVPSAFTVKTGAAHWEVLLRARAIETQCYVIAAAQSGICNCCCITSSHICSVIVCYKFAPNLQY